MWTCTNICVLTSVDFTGMNAHGSCLAQTPEVQESHANHKIDHISFWFDADQNIIHSCSGVSIKCSSSGIVVLYLG